jgi:hypothetical protein
MTALIELYANNAYSTLGSPVSSSGQTTVTVTNGAVFPSPTGNQFFRITVTLVSAPNTVIEIMYCTSRTGNNLTVMRGQEGTTAITWVTGSLCANEATAGTYNQFMQPYVGVDTGAVDAYVVSTQQHQTAYYTGMPCTFYTLNANTSAAPTLNLNGLGASYIKNANGSPLTSSQLPANAPISVQYNTDDTSWRLVSPLGLPTNLTPLKAVVTDSVGRISTADPSVTQINYLSNWIQAITGSNAANGWIQLSNGLIVQWGEANITGNPTPVFFPVAFPHAMFTVVVSEGQAEGTWIAGNPTIHGASPSDRFAYFGYAFTWNGSGWNAATSGGISQNWIAIGY